MVIFLELFHINEKNRLRKSNPARTDDLQLSLKTLQRHLLVDKSPWFLLQFYRPMKAHFSTLCVSDWLSVEALRAQMTLELHNLVLKKGPHEAPRHNRDIWSAILLDFVPVCKLNQTTCISKSMLQRCTNVVHVIIISLLYIYPKQHVYVHMCVCVCVCMFASSCLSYVFHIWKHAAFILYLTIGY